MSKITPPGGVSQGQLDALPELAAADPTEVGLATAGGTTTLTIEDTIARAPTVAWLTATSAAVNDSTTLVDITGLGFALPVGTFFIDSFLNYRSLTAADYKFGFTFSGTATGAWGLDGIIEGATGVEGAIRRPTVSSWGSSTRCGAIDSNDMFAKPAGLIIVTVAGTLQAQHAQQNATVGDTTARTGSWLRAMKVA